MALGLGACKSDIAQAGVCNNEFISFWSHALAITHAH